MSKQQVTAASLGLPEQNVSKWFSDIEFNEVIQKPIFRPKALINKEIPRLKNYRNDPGPIFWGSFPFKPLPSASDKNSPIDICALQQNYFTVRDKMSQEEINLMEVTIDNLRFGADAHVDESKLPAMEATNNKSMLQPVIGQQYTDTLASMVKSGIVAGPFLKPPLDDFRSNSLFAIEQNDKLRPILNLS